MVNCRGILSLEPSPVWPEQCALPSYKSRGEVHLPIRPHADAERLCFYCVILDQRRVFTLSALVCPGTEAFLVHGTNHGFVRWSEAESPDPHLLDISLPQMFNLGGGGGSG